jgi:hypothetical protein
MSSANGTDHVTTAITNANGIAAGCVAHKKCLECLISASENKTALLLGIAAAAQEINAGARGVFIAISTARDESLFLRASSFGLASLARHHQIEQNDQRACRQHLYECIEHLFICEAR